MTQNFKTIWRLALAIVVIAIVAMSLYSSYKYHNWLKKYEAEPYTDTIPFYVPIPKDSLVITYKTVTLPIAPSNPTPPDSLDTNVGKPVDTISVRDIPAPDSIDVKLPIIQKEYKDSLYHAWVSGYDVQLDSIKLFYERPVIPHDPLFEWSVGIQAGVGWFGDGFKPYIGVGVQIGIDLKKLKKRKH